MNRKKRHFYPLNRVEGDLEIRIELENNMVSDAWSAGIMYRGFENLLIGRAVLDGLVLTPRICGICSTSHLKAAAKALDMFFNVKLPDNAIRIRNVTLIAETIQNDFRHAFMLFMADFTNPVYQKHLLFDEAVRRYQPLSGETTIQTIEETKKILEIIALLGGQWPHSSFMVPGGVVCVPSANDLAQCLFLIRNFRKWFERRVLGCPIERWKEVKSRADLEVWLHESESHMQSDLGLYLRFAEEAGLKKTGKGYENFISFGSLDLPEDTKVKSVDENRQFLPSGFFHKFKLYPFDQTKITEDVSHSWFDEGNGANHPFDGETNPYATGKESGKYSWAKAPRYDQLPAETGPLAEMVVASNPLFVDLINNGGSNVYVRELARLVRSVYLIPVMEQWLEETARCREEFYQDHVNKDEGKGCGLVEAPRGALGHWVKIKDAKIQKYQIITPTAWNASPRDASDLRGPCEEAIVGTEIKSPDNPVEVDHIIRSFDPCLVCTVHTIDLRRQKDYQPFNELVNSMEILAQPSKGLSTLDGACLALAEENALLRKEIQVARKAAELTANLVVKQFEETEKVLHRFQVANAQRKAVLDSATQISIIATNRDGVITVFNTGAENLLGYKAQDMIGKKTPELFHLQSELEIVSHSLSFKRGGRVTGLDIFFEYAVQGQLTQSEWTYVRKDGTQFPVRMTINVLRDPDGDISGLLFIAMDTAEIKRSEKALKESERNYRLLIRNLPNCVYKGYLDGSIDFFDNKIEQITGYSKEEFLSRKKNWFSLVHEDDLEYSKEKFKLALRTDSSYIREYRVKSKSGDTIWIQDGGQIIYGENGEVEFITGAFLDITERKLAEKALHESEEKYRSLFDSGPDPIFVLDRSTLEILDANPMAEDTYRYSKSELTGMRFSMLGPVDDILKGIFNFNKNDWPKACIVSSRVQHYRKYNKPFYVRVTACPTRYKDRDAIILATTDITEMLEKEAQLLQASKMTGLGEMSTGVAHELNQPLNAIKMGSEYLMMMVESKKKISEKNLVEVAKQISEQVDRASEIMDRLREFGHLPDFAKEKVDINKAVQVAYGIVGQQIRLQNIEVAIDLQEKLPPILAHNTRMEQVIFNLVTNAQDAVNQKKKAGLDVGKPAITIRSFVENDRVALTFSDNGIGITKDVLDKVFEPFFTTKQVGNGLGLGLSITYGIVKDYDGEIEIQSEEGIGTTVKMTFPRTPA